MPVDVCSALSYLNQNSDVYLGYVGWSAGAFSTSYVLSLTPSGSASAGWVDQPLLTQCFQKEFAGGSSGTQSTPMRVSSSSASAAPIIPSYLASSASADSTNPIPSASAPAAAIAPSSTSIPVGDTSTLSASSTAGALVTPSAGSPTVVSHSASSAPSGFEKGSSISHGMAVTYSSVPTTFLTRTSSSIIASLSPSFESPRSGADDENECETDY